MQEDKQAEDFSEDEESDASFEDLTEEEEASLLDDVKIFADTVFPQFWTEHKIGLKDSSKKELAEQMYCLGLFHAMHYHHTQMKGTMKKAEELEKNPSLLQNFLEEMQRKK